jgi:hypothetical protein
MAVPEDKQPAWYDFKSYTAHVRAACARLQAPQPTLQIIELQYPERCAELARARAVDEVMEARERRESRRLKVAR